MRLLDHILHVLWDHWTAGPPLPCCPASCIHFASFR